MDFRVQSDPKLKGLSSQLNTLTSFLMEMPPSRVGRLPLHVDSPLIESHFQLSQSLFKAFRPSIHPSPHDRVLLPVALSKPHIRSKN
ncbi:hypothetical protein VTL71DRAFT_12397 [Oculimacula yallundae]|uniref:Uncharacterized protein n=1 Tax=Oculimacula yallundae TaxID=86028 RepID=A0ABR4CNQ2_9HELO